MIRYLIIIIFFLLGVGCNTKRLVLSEVVEKTDYATDTVNNAVIGQILAFKKTTTEYTSKSENRQKERTKRKEIGVKSDSLKAEKKIEKVKTTEATKQLKELTKQTKEATKQTEIINHVNIWDKMKNMIVGGVIGLLALFILKKLLWK